MQRGWTLRLQHNLWKAQSPYGDSAKKKGGIQETQTNLLRTFNQLASDSSPDSRAQLEKPSTMMAFSFSINELESLHVLFLRKQNILCPLFPLPDSALNHYCI